VKPKKINLPRDNEFMSSGIEIEYIKSRDTLIIGGFYDNIVGIESTEIKFADFCKELGIPNAKR